MMCHWQLLLVLLLRFFTATLAVCQSLSTRAVSTLSLEVTVTAPFQLEVATGSARGGLSLRLVLLVRFFCL